jgi:hypothetical protein
LEKMVAQNPLIETRPTLAALGRSSRNNAPRAVFLGIGLCTRDAISTELPFDTLGVLLPAELVRRAVGASRLVVAVADRHALSNGLNRCAVYRRSHHVKNKLETIARRCGLNAMTVVRASEFHATPEYRLIRAQIEESATGGTHTYFKSEAADIEFFHRTYGGIVKVGWTVGRAATVSSRRDEVAFDRRFQQWCGPHVAFVYCKAGRALDDRKKKAVPYTVLNPIHRICLTENEDVSAKLRTAAVTATTRNGVRNHLRRVTRIFSQTVFPLSGPVERRAQQIIDFLHKNP